MTITKIHARQILDSRGNPTVECDVILDDGTLGRAAVPSGASTGEHEEVELRDHDQKNYGGLSVLDAVENVNTAIAEKIESMDPNSQSDIDQTMIDLDRTDNKSKLGANAILSVSLACAKAAALAKKIPLYQHFGELVDNADFVLPMPMMNIINGGKHAIGSTDIQEFLIIPVGAKTFSQALEMGDVVFHKLRQILAEKGYPTTVGDEGGYAPHFKNGNAEALDCILEAIDKSDLVPGQDIAFGLDVAASELYHNGKYHLATENRTLSAYEMITWLQSLVEKYPIVSIEDGLAQDDWANWQHLHAELGSKIQLIGDDIFVTNTRLIEKGIAENIANAVLIKPNQVGTLTETFAAVDLAKKANWNSIISHRSGETEDTSIVHLAVGLAAGQIKTGSLSREERIAKYDELLRIEEAMGQSAKFASPKFHQ